MNSQLPATDGRCIGFVGLGNMGQPIAACLLRSGFSLVVNDIIPTNANPLCDQGAQWVDDPRAIAHSCDIICTSLPGPDEFRDVFHSERGIVAGAQAGSTCIDFTTNSPSAVQEAGARLAAQGASLLDAPVSGGVERAQTGELTVLVGGADADFQRCKRVFDSVA